MSLQRFLLCTRTVLFLLLSFHPMISCQEITPSLVTTSSLQSLRRLSKNSNSVKRNGMDIQNEFPTNHEPSRRRLQNNIFSVQPNSTNTTPYFRTNDTAILGKPDVNAAIGNPLKGLAGGPRYSQSSPLPNSVPSAIEFYNFGLDEIMIGNNQFNWTLHDQFLTESASRKMHAVLSVYIHWPGRPLQLPPHLSNLPLYNTDNSGMSPNYGDSRLLTALEQFIVAWGNHTDGDTRVAAVHVGLLGFWGEGHTYPDTALVPESSKQSVAQWYRQSFKKTQVQARYPGPNAVGFGLYDGSLAYYTLDGIANGGKEVGWFMYPQIKSAKQEDNWKQYIIGGETRPELQNIIFTSAYPARTENHQDYKECVDTLHISYALHHGAFQDGGYTGDVLRNANAMHAYMGYAFYVSEVAAYQSTVNATQAVDVLVQVTQLGVAPFYYDLSLVLECGSGLLKTALPGVHEIILQGEAKGFIFRNVPATAQCLEQMSLSLQSSYAYSGRPVRFAQGTEGKVSFRLPSPPQDPAPVASPIQSLPVPSSAPVLSPIIVPVGPPVVVEAPVSPMLVPSTVVSPPITIPVGSPMVPVVAAPVSPMLVPTTVVSPPITVPVGLPMLVPTTVVSAPITVPVVGSPMVPVVAAPVIRVPVQVPTIFMTSPQQLSPPTTIIPLLQRLLQLIFPKLKWKLWSF
jgi:hypothetical protein